MDSSIHHTHTETQPIHAEDTHGSTQQNRPSLKESVTVETLMTA